MKGLRHNSAGFSILEALFSLLIFSIVLSALAYSLGQLTRVSQSRKNFGTELEVLQIANQIRADIANARSQVVEAAKIKLTGINPKISLNERLEWEEDDSRAVQEILYEYKEGWLYREEKSSTGVESYPLAQLETCTISSIENSILIELTIKGLNRDKPFKIRAVSQR